MIRFEVLCTKCKSVMPRKPHEFDITCPNCGEQHIANPSFVSTSTGFQAMANWVEVEQRPVNPVAQLLANVHSKLVIEGYRKSNAQ